MFLSFILYRGHSSNETKAFRADYKKLAEVRAFLPSSIPVVALTATATEQVRVAIIASLQMTNIHLIEGSPNRENIKFIIIDSEKKRPHEDIKTWDWLTSRLDRLKENMPRIIIYCRSRKQCTGLYSIFKTQIPSDKNFAMYHATTPKEVQLEIVNDFESEDGHIRVLFATIAFGMGVNVKGVHTIMHLGVPSDIDDYIQESGRAGRDGQQSISILLKYPGMYTDSSVDERMKTFVNSTNVCRRQLLLEHFGIKNHVHAKQGHTCCDICATTCSCDGEMCKGMQVSTEVDILSHFGFTRQDKGDITHLPCRQVPISVRDNLKQQLKQYRCSLLDEETKYLAGGDITCGLPLETLDRIVLECAVVIPYDVFRERYPIYNDEISKHVWMLAEETLKGCNIVEEPNHTVEAVSINAGDSDEVDDDEQNDDDEENDDLDDGISDDYWRDFEHGLFVVSDSD